MTTDNPQPEAKPEAQPAPEAKPAVAAAVEAGAEPKPLADPALAKLGDAFLKDGQPDLEKIAEALGRVHTDLPGEGADYELKFPETFDLKGADGEVVKLDPADPIVGSFKEWAKANNIGQKATDGLMAIYGDIIKSAYDVNTEAAKEVQTAEYAKLDTDRKAAEARVLAASRGLTQTFGKDSALVAPLIESMTTAAHVIAIETIIAKINGTSTANPKPNGKADTKSFAERLYS